MAQKIATCCYCGGRSTLVLCGSVQRELACAACGAPLRRMKAMPVERADTKVAVNPPMTSRPRRKPKKRPRKMRKFSPMRAIREVVDDLWDEIEDLFD